MRKSRPDGLPQYSKHEVLCIMPMRTRHSPVSISVVGCTKSNCSTTATVHLHCVYAISFFVQQCLSAFCSRSFFLCVTWMEYCVNRPERSAPTICINEQKLNNEIGMSATTAATHHRVFVSVVIWLITFHRGNQPVDLPTGRQTNIDTHCARCSRAQACQCECSIVFSMSFTLHAMLSIPYDFRNNSFFFVSFGRSFLFNFLFDFSTYEKGYRNQITIRCF